jgi:hypothetical protein
MERFFLLFMEEDILLGMNDLYRTLRDVLEKTDHDATLTNKPKFHRSVLGVLSDNGTEKMETNKGVKNGDYNWTSHTLPGHYFYFT